MKRFAPIIAAVLIVLLGGGAAWFLLGNGKSAAAPQPQPTPVGIGPLTTNLKDDQGHRFVQTDLVIEVDGQEQAAHMTESEAAVRDAVLRVLRASTSDELEGADGMNALRDRLRAALGVTVPDVTVLNIYFKDLVVQ